MRTLVTLAFGLGLALFAASCQGLLAGGEDIAAVDSGVGEADSAVAVDDAAPGLADAASTPDPDAAPTSDPDAAPGPIDCSGIAADPDYELCESDATSCAGVFTDGSGCIAYCAAAGLVCSARYGGEPGCNKEPSNVLGCFDNNGHGSDWCECEAAGGGGGGDCELEPGNPPVVMEIGKNAATYTERHNWVLGCYPYAYTASGAEHQACDSQFFPDGSRTGTATFSFTSVPSGSYDVYIYSRHTENRNSSGALFYVDGHAKVIMQNDDADYTWDLHGTYCLDGAVDVVLDSSVNGGSDSVQTVRLTPTP